MYKYFKQIFRDIFSCEVSKFISAYVNCFASSYEHIVIAVQIHISMMRRPVRKLTKRQQGPRKVMRSTVFPHPSTIIVSACNGAPSGLKGSNPNCT